jgi:hypothetical protein
MILTVLLLSFMTTAQQPSPPPADNFGVIEGVVVDQDGKPVEGAYVYSIGNAEGKRPMGGRCPPGPIVMTDSAGKFTLFHVLPDNPVSVYASKLSDYYPDACVLSMFVLQNSKIPEVEVNVGQPVNVIVRLAKKVGRIQFYVRDADSKELVHGIFMQSCRKGTPAKYCVGGMSGPSDYTTLISPGFDFSIQIEADDGQHEKWEYHDPKSGSRYIRGKSGKTETLNIYLRKKK